MNPIDHAFQGAEVSSKVVPDSNGEPKGAIESKAFKEGCSALKGV
jgi:hypothetical protein